MIGGIYKTTAKKGMDPRSDTPPSTPSSLIAWMEDLDSLFFRVKVSF